MRLALFVAGLFVGLYYMGVLEPVSGGSGYRLGAILPRADLGSSMPNLSASLVWAASMFVAAMFVWYLPRIMPSALLAIPCHWPLAGRAEAAERMEKIYRWRIVALCGAVASFFAALAALYAPVPQRHPGPHARAPQQLLVGHPRADDHHVLRRRGRGLDDWESGLGIFRLWTLSHGGRRAPPAAHSAARWLR